MRKLTQYLIIKLLVITSYSIHYTKLYEITVISQQFHNERAIYIAKHNDIEAIGFNAKDVGQRFGFKTMVRERFARVKMILDLLIGKQPKFSYNFV